MPRKIKATFDSPAVSKDEIAKILAYYITGGDPVGYLARLAEQQAKEQVAS